MSLGSLPPKRNDGRIIIHFDYDAFYASTFEREDPKLHYLPLAVQQKQIIVTCNYEARRRGLHKMQLVKEARKVCPDVIIVLGEDLTRFRNASKELYAFLTAFAWSNKVERLGFDEVFLDVTDMVNYNVELLNHHDVTTSFFHLDRNDPIKGFAFDASRVVGHIFPTPTKHAGSAPALPAVSPSHDESTGLYVRLLLGSHLAFYLRHQLEEQKGYSSTVGISTNKLISKLVGNLNKPKGQTTLMPPYFCSEGVIESSVTQFIDSHDIGQIPGIGFKLAQKIRGHVLGRPGIIDVGHIYGGTKEMITVKEVRLLPDMGPGLLEKLLGGPGAPKDTGDRIWGLMNGVDDSEVLRAKTVPQQISIEDTYLRLHVMEDVKKELLILARSLIRRMHLDLMSNIDETDDADLDKEERSARNQTHISSSQWLAHPRTLRLTTRPRLPLNLDGTRPRTFTRISKSCNMPSVVFSKTYSIECIAEKLTDEALIPLFRKLHPERSGWDLSLINICATNISPLAVGGASRDISRMFKRQEDVLKEWKVEDVDVAPSESDTESQHARKIDYVTAESTVVTNKPQDDYLFGSEDKHIATQESFLDDNAWDNESDPPDRGEACSSCGAIMPAFAMVAHERFHTLPD